MDPVADMDVFRFAINDFTQGPDTVIELDGGEDYGSVLFQDIFSRPRPYGDKHGGKGIDFSGSFGLLPIEIQTETIETNRPR